MFILSLISVLLFNPTYAAHGQLRIPVTPRIYRGEKSERSQFPYMASIREVKTTVDEQKTYHHFCGAAVISEYWVISASHCFRGDKLIVSNIKVFAGVHYFNKDGRMKAVERIIKHENYDKSLKINDITLLQTKKPIQFDKRVQPVAISKEWIGAGQFGVFAGFGITDSGSLPLVLRHISLRTITNAECIEMHSDKHRRRIHNSTLCTFVGYGIGTCHGDSGGAMVINNQLVGILSWGVPCAVGKPDQFTRISEYLTWIKEKTNSTI